ncbi:uncharacterized protein ARMOST_03223 [Armillaria ostoyae]|uniref:Uncharacterized protein n=1 Tax=Armillaria ostoyae TaxID=47428 RepID=A0A284QTV8_ARMOS|nr:uncharacterized protein ARMOST_03223 [Armillaria ostoyae]
MTGDGWNKPRTAKKCDAQALQETVDGHRSPSQPGGMTLHRRLRLQEGPTDSLPEPVATTTLYPCRTPKDSGNKPTLPPDGHTPSPSPFPYPSPGQLSSPVPRMLPLQ